MAEPPRRLGLDELAARLEPRCAEAAAGRLQPAPGIRVRWLPEWVAEHGLARGGDAVWIWIGPRADGAGAPGRVDAGRDPDQIVLDVPPGRYLLDVCSATTGERITRESAAAAPLVAGLPFRGEPLVICLRPL
jgi:hypothetical protein